MSGSSWPTYRTIGRLKVTYIRLWEERRQTEAEGWRDGWRGLGGRNADSDISHLLSVDINEQNV